MAAVITDKIWKNREAKFRGLVFLLKENPDVIVACWFQQTRSEIDKWITSFGVGKLQVHDVFAIRPADVAGKNIVILERYPLFSKEENIFSSWNAKRIIVLSSLDDELLCCFGGDRIVSLLEKMGMKEDEEIEHAMVMQAILNAQKKLEKTVAKELPTTSQAEWFRFLR